MEKKHTISILVENEFGVLARVAGLFAQKGYNIESLSVSETTDPTLSRITLVTSGSDLVLRHILKQLNKLINVLTSEDLTKEKHVTREMFLVKLKRGEKTKKEMQKLADDVEGKFVESDGEAFILEVSAEDDTEWGIAYNKLKRHEILEIARSGMVALQRGEHVLVSPKGEK